MAHGAQGSHRLEDLFKAETVIMTPLLFHKHITSILGKSFLSKELPEDLEPLRVVFFLEDH